ncbi:TIM-barrel domain-containing protein [Dactylosporangium sp. CA-092794]|uniref:TIM-barrel domain-containing protein n=1 Tax=Dactylosporangium sp. CA-092794 TaxID=3239929 RepID=UPI003D8EBF94
MVLRPPTSPRFLTVAAVLAVIAGLLPAPPALAAPPPRPASDSAVVSGKARFEVLSPTLIRTEYAGDSRFVDAATFNAVGRDDFRRTPFTAKTINGWLTIDTGAVTLRYQAGSGPFTDENLQLSLRVAGQSVAARPWAAQAGPRCPAGRLCEAEDLKLDGPAVATDHAGYTGRGFAAGFVATGHAIGFDVDAAGEHQLAVRYANSQGGDGQNTTRTLTVTIDGGSAQTLTLPVTGSWDTWAVAAVPLTLPAGRHTVTIVRSASDSGNVNVDSLAVLAPGAGYPAPTPPEPAACRFGAICEADTGALTGGAKLANDHDGYSGLGFLAGLERAGAGTAIHITGVPAAGSYTLQLRYANAEATPDPIQPRRISVQAGSAAPATVTLAPTSGWDAWRTIAVPVDLAAGDNTVTLGCPDATSCHVNFDTVAVVGRGSPLLAPHAPLGGYRRGLDGVDGTAVTTPGLLYQDGWTLIDDTPSALYDPATRAVTPRPAHGGLPYLDGYVFGYGHDYQRGLADLATLTGPAKLLPRWAYGVWYSEYYDRTAADFQQTIVPRFRAERVPLDVLVVDTDFKAPNRWNSWAIDPQKFPDPAAFFAWAHAQGLHTTLNVHPSILAADPLFPQAQATAKGKLARGGCGGGGGDCYVFDFGDPDQLAAYLGLHRTMEQYGVDFWWLDWCCDGSYSGLAGVTPDSWINLAYAGDDSFAFSRGYGSLQAGGYGGQVGVPTGPWAEKRTTLHFTGDTISDWKTLKYEVGYTPGESVATGLPSVSHDIGGHTMGLQEPGSEPGSTKLPDDLYARWVQFGTFQPIDRLHSNHSDRLPWQYGPDARRSATAFLNLRERLVPYTYTLARQASAAGLPIARPLYLQYPDDQEAYANASSEYLYGPDVLVAPATDPGPSATTKVWFPAGSTWTDYFTGRTYQGGTTAEVTTTLDTMPVFIRSGGMLVTRSADVAGDAQPVGDLTVTVAEGRPGRFTLSEDGGATGITYDRHTVTIAPARSAAHRAWTVTFANATPPKAVRVNGRKLSPDAWTWNGTTRTLTVHAPAQRDGRLTVAYS